jgi:hypothetical protein
VMRLSGLILIAIFSLFSISASAKDLSNRLGLGYKDQFSNDVPGMAVQYYPNREFGLAAVLGLDTQKDHSKFGLMLKAMRVVFEEDNLNFYMGGGAGLISTEVTPNTNESGFELNGFAGVEFFFAGLESLGFSLETGVGISSIASETRFRTIGDSPLRAGATFYF